MCSSLKDKAKDQGLADRNIFAGVDTSLPFADFGPEERDGHSP